MSYKTLSSKELTYEQFQATTDHFATSLVLKAKGTYPNARDLEFAKQVMLGGIGFFINEPQEGMAKKALDFFDVAYKLGMPLRTSLIQILKSIITEKIKAANYWPKIKDKLILKKWGKVPLPWPSHFERYEDGELTARVYRKGGGIQIESVKAIYMQGRYESELISDPTMRNLWRFLVSVYASRKIKIIYDEYKFGQHPLALLNAKAEDIAAEVENANPVSSAGRPLKKMAWNASQKRLAELFIALEEKQWITAPVAGAIQRAFDKSNSIPNILKPGKTAKSNKRNYPEVFTTEYTRCFDCIPVNPEKI